MPGAMARRLSTFGYVPPANVAVARSGNTGAPAPRTSLLAQAPSSPRQAAAVATRAMKRLLDCMIVPLKNGVGSAAVRPARGGTGGFTTGSRSEEHTSELQSLIRHAYAVFFLKKK